MKKFISMPVFRKWLPAVIVLIYLMPIFLVKAAFSAYLKIPDIPGESQDDGHKEWINLDSVQQGIARPVSGAGSSRVVGNAEFSDIAVTKWLDKSTPVLMLNCCKGTVFPKVEIDMLNTDTSSGKEQYMKYTLTDVLVSSATAKGTAGSEPLPSETLSFNFAKIEIDYTEQIIGGGILFTTNVSCSVDQPN